MHLGAFTATIMSANVFFVIIPNQTIVVADLKAGRTPDPKYGAIAKLRSTHNNYLTLPVLFLMLSNHYPLAFATEWNWLIASLVFLMGVTIRHYFNTMHADKDSRTGPGRRRRSSSSSCGCRRRREASARSWPCCRRCRRSSRAPRDCGRGRHGARALLDVPRDRGGLAGRAVGAEGVLLETDADIAARVRGGSAGGAQPRDAAGERNRDGAGRAAGDHPLVSRCGSRLSARPIGPSCPRRLSPMIGGSPATAVAAATM